MAGLACTGILALGIVDSDAGAGASAQAAPGTGLAHGATGPHIATAQHSVYLVLEIDGDSERSLATAFSVGDGFAATNAHVVENTGTLRLRATGAGPDLRVVETIVHPGYRQFGEMTIEHQALDAVTREAACLVHAADVALLRIHEEDLHRLGEPLPLAPEPAVLDLALGDPITMLGFPLQVVSYDGYAARHPAPKLQVGVIVSLTDPWLGANSRGDSIVIQHSLPALPGSSGSPILDGRGRVIGIHSACPMIDGAPVQGFGYAQRSDLLAELLAGRAAIAQRARHDRWLSLALEAVKAGHVGDRRLARSILDDSLVQQFGESLDQYEVLVADRMEFGPGDPTMFTWDRAVAADARFACIAVASDGSDIDLDVLSGADLVAQDLLLDSMPVGIARLAGGTRLQLRIHGPGAVGGGQFYLLVARRLDGGRTG